MGVPEPADLLLFVIGFAGVENKIRAGTAVAMILLLTGQGVVEIAPGMGVSAASGFTTSIILSHETRYARHG